MTIRILFAAVAAVAAAGAGRAAPINASFEAADFTGWATVGDASVVTAAVGVTPTDGTHLAFLTTASRNGDANAFSGTDAAPAAAVRAFLGLPAGAFPAGFEGSAVRQSFAANAGDVIAFDYKFLTTEGANTDVAFVTLGGPGVLADTATAAGPSLVALDPVFGDPARETAWRTFAYTAPAAGVYTVGVGVLDAGDEFLPSALLVDRVSLTPSSAAVPEPGTWAVAAALAVVGLRRKRPADARTERDRPSGGVRLGVSVR